MASLTKPYESYEKPGLIHVYDLASTPVLKGGLVGINTGGLAAPLSPATAMRFIGVAMESGDPATPYGKSVQVAKLGSYVFRAADGWTPTAASIGTIVYAESDWEVRPTTTGMTNPVAVGTVVSLERTSTGATGVRVRIDLHTV